MRSPWASRGCPSSNERSGQRSKFRDEANVGQREPTDIQLCSEPWNISETSRSHAELLSKNSLARALARIAEWNGRAKGEFCVPREAGRPCRRVWNADSIFNVNNISDSFRDMRAFYDVRLLSCFVSPRIDSYVCARVYVTASRPRDPRIILG